MKKVLLSFALAFILLKISAQEPLKAHSHNDYANVIPFWIAYYNHFSSIEADIWLVNNELFVAHDNRDIKPERTLKALYIQPLVNMVRYNGGKPWHDYPSGLQLLIDLKTEGVATLNMLTEMLKEYPDVFDPAANRDAVRIVISGNRPDPSLYSKYPSFIFFDGIIGNVYSNEQLMRIPLFSENLKSVIKWDGTAPISEDDRKKLVFMVDSIHAMNKKVRFWNAPDNQEAWITLLNAGVDYVNTDHINQLATFLKNR
ncbi:MAG TPA: phosphatidylinositol-specific phospholipase C/glycerophosphodiester phosphodiesterase family protein [Bacteroidales bacterium]|nr:phosphatidylinositol-specific phospholipase C/glycerophosphodiester phosphodiesterase family protein [Bacteroidales bacterium]